MDTAVDPTTPDFDALREISQAFRQHFGRPPQAGARAPGRVNLIGEHTDYNEGWVLPCAIDRATFCLLAARDDHRMRLWARDLDAEVEFAASEMESFELPKEHLPKEHDWAAYPLAVVRALAERGIAIPGFDLAITSRVPSGSGLSSSAALVVSLAAAFDSLLGLGFGPEDWARVGHRAESHHMGIGCGILDHFASALGRRDTALHIDCQNQAVTHVPFPGDAVELLVAHSGVTRRLATAEGGYRQRVAECAQALEAAKRAGLVKNEARSLRALDGCSSAQLEAALDGVSLRRARHVLTENQRVARFCAAMQARDFESLGSVLREGHRSLRDDYEVSIAELDALCEIADELPGVFGSRLTGAGFGGCTLHLVEPDAAAAAAIALADRFEARFASRPAILEARVSDGASVVDVGAS